MNNKLENLIPLVDGTLEAIMKNDNATRSEAAEQILEFFGLAYLRNDESCGFDALDVSLVYDLLNWRYTDMLAIKIYHDLYYSEYFESVMECKKSLSEANPHDHRPEAVAEMYFDRFYKPGYEDLETFLWRCLCAGVLPGEEFLRMNEEERHQVFTKEMKWIHFDALLDMDEEAVDTAIHMTAVIVDGEEIAIDSPKQ